MKAILVFFDERLQGSFTVKEDKIKKIVSGERKCLSIMDLRWLGGKDQLLEPSFYEDKLKVAAFSDFIKEQFDREKTGFLFLDKINNFSVLSKFPKLFSDVHCIRLTISDVLKSGLKSKFVVGEELIVDSKNPTLYSCLRHNLSEYYIYNLLQQPINLGALTVSGAIFMDRAKSLAKQGINIDFAESNEEIRDQILNLVMR